MHRWIPHARADKALLHSGPKSIIDDIEDQLLAFVEEWCSTGLPVNHFILMQMAGALKPEFLKKSKQATKMSISCGNMQGTLPSKWSWGWGIWISWHQKKAYPVEHNNRDLDYVINMDQTPVYHAMDFKNTINSIGEYTVNLHTSTCDSKHASTIVAVTLTASGWHRCLGEMNL